MRAWAKVGGLGALGLVVAAVLAALSLQLVSQPVGLSSEPLTAGDRLAPVQPAKDDTGSTQSTATPATGRKTRRTAKTRARPSPTTPPRTGDDYRPNDDSNPSEGGGHDGDGHDD